MWSARTPAGEPDVIVLAAGEADVVRAVALLGNRVVRRRVLPRALPRALARHCAEEYANLAALLPELYERFGPAAVSS